MKKQYPLISVITVSYNAVSTIEDTILSVINQTYTNIEYIIIDGGSADGTVGIIEKYVDRISYWVSEPDKGIYDAMNKGIQMASGDIVGILNSDDLFLDSNVLGDIVQAFDSKIEAVCGNLYFVKFDDTDSIVRTWKGSPYHSFNKGWHPAHPTFYVRRSVYQKYGIFDTSFSVSADFELMLRFIEKYRIRTKYLDRYMIKMRVGGESTRSLKNIFRGNKNIMRAFKKNDIPVSVFYPVRRLFPKALDMLKNKIGLT